jgi:hypothetical protein
MTKRWLLAAVVSLLLPLSGNVWSQAGFLRLEDLRPGMKGTGKTCFQGSKPEEFQAEILGLMRHVSPGGDAVLARFSGGPLSETGIFEGMSGSPVFVDGKLLGAVAFSFPFAKEAIGGITPIAEMVDAFTEGLAVENRGVRVSLKKSMLWKYEPPAPAGLGLAPGSEVTELDARLQPALAPFAGHTLLPIATPLSLGGFSAETLRTFSPQFRALGFSTLQGSGAASLQAGSPSPASGPASGDSSLEPGSNLVVPLVIGDLDVSAGGTVTYINGSKVYAFGHSLLNLGFSQLPMYKGSVLAVLPSLQSSFKILETTEPVGALRQDRSMGVYGLLGEHARTIPMRIRMTASRGVKKVWNFQVAQDRFLTPLMINLTVFETIISTERAMGASTLKVKGKISLRGEQPIEIENRCSSDISSSANAAMSIAAPVNFLLALGYKNLQFEDIDLEISAVEDNRAVSLDSIRVDRTELKAGQSVNVGFFYKKANGEIIQDSYPVRIPPEITPGSLSMLVADGNTIMEMDALEQGEELIPRDLTQLIKLINDIRKNDRLYVRLFRRAAGAVIDGEGLPGLPPSILSILKSERNTGSMSPLQTLPLMEYELPPSDYVVSGAKLLNLVINP